MLRTALKPLVVTGLLVALTVATTGCKPWKYGFGFLAGLATMSEFNYTETDQTCYRNGVEVDCSELEAS